MFHSMYVTTKDTKGRVRRYRLGTGEQLPEGHTFVAAERAGFYPIAEAMSSEDLIELAAFTNALERARR